MFHNVHTHPQRDLTEKLGNDNVLERQHKHTNMSLLVS